jgi:hypothetical protein
LAQQMDGTSSDFLRKALVLCQGVKTFILKNLFFRYVKYIYILYYIRYIYIYKYVCYIVDIPKKSAKEV